MCVVGLFVLFCFAESCNHMNLLAHNMFLRGLVAVASGNNKSVPRQHTSTLWAYPSTHGRNMNAWYNMHECVCWTCLPAHGGTMDTAIPHTWRCHACMY